METVNKLLNIRVCIEPNYNSFLKNTRDIIKIYKTVLDTYKTISSTTDLLNLLRILGSLN